MKTIHVYKTDVNEPSNAQANLDEIRRTHPNSDPSFDLEDCDKILRIEDPSGIDEDEVEFLLQRHGFRLDPLL